jgi:hypothetical protein
MLIYINSYAFSSEKYPATENFQQGKSGALHLVTHLVTGAL